ncbi:hypothetical protein KUL42_32470 [Alteromonas sp. KUL42]|uniref:hypothetical protein n=1 Tax=Alteromonas sp. KUL42 TaxID=2480797 RepID=UPI001036AA70|nr:hypothetical protein [Alteromonas sp. KUL42]TAP33267.1 hypothetical protein EYR97_15295 [Alteromonas sp. KUL42]GEA08486.1 hypothetical protein KUL42_32470 [Alteromonas sp. KUL42]
MLDKFLGRNYSPANYNCVHFTVEVWQALTGNNIEQALTLFMRPSNDRKASMSLRRSFKKLEAPQSPCLALMQRQKTSPHLGVYYKNKIIHITELGVENVEPSLAARGFEKVTYYQCL